MGSRSSLANPFNGSCPPAITDGGSSDGAVDRLLGTAYDQVRHVATHIEHVKHVSYHLAQIYRLSGSVAEVDALAENITGLEAIAAELDALLQLSAVNDKLAELVAIHAKLTELHAIYANLTTLVALPTTVTRATGGEANIDGKLTIGAYKASYVYNTVGSDLQVVETGLNNLISLFGLNASTAGPNLNFLKSRSGNLDTRLKPNVGDTLAKITAWGDDGAAFSRAGYMEFTVNSTVAAGRVPGNFNLYLTDSTGAEQNILSAFPNRVGIGANNPNANTKLHVRSGDFGGTQTSLGNQLLAEASGNAAIVFQSPNTSVASIYFRDNDDGASNTSGYLRYDHTSDALIFSAKGERLRLDANGMSVGAGNVVVDANRHLRLRSYTLATLPAASAAAGQIIYCSDLGGGGGELVSDGTAWKRASGGGYQVNNTNGNTTLQVLTNAEEQRNTATLTADRTITLSTTNVYAGARFRVTRTGGGAFNLDLGGLKNLATNTWAEVVYASGVWYLAAYGTL